MYECSFHMNSVCGEGLWILYISFHSWRS